LIQTAVMQLEHPVLALLIEQAQAELAALTRARNDLPDWSGQQGRPQRSQEPGTAG